MCAVPDLSDPRGRRAQPACAGGCAERRRGRGGGWVHQLQLALPRSTAHALCPVPRRRGALLGCSPAIHMRRGAAFWAACFLLRARHAAYGDLLGDHAVQMRRDAARATVLQGLPAAAAAADVVTLDDSSHSP